MNHDDPVRPSVDSDFRALATSAMRLAAGIVDDMPEGAQGAIGNALQSGARLFLEFGPLPLFSAATLYLVEPEGRRERLGSVSVNEGPAQ